MRLPERILHTACLLGFKKETPQYSGSGFLAAVPGSRGNSDLYVVTARHLARRMECCPIIMGFNYKDGSKALLEADDVHWYVHPTESDAVDAAVTPFAPSQLNLLDIEPVSVHLFASAESVRNGSIEVGDGITAISEFTRFAYQEDRHLPIARTGTLAMLPALRVPVKGFDPMDAYIGEIEGLSGSPVWARPTASSGESNPILLGVLHGRWEIAAGAMKGLSAQYTEKMTSGMSVIVPAHKILEVINQPKLAALREKGGEKKA